MDPDSYRPCRYYRHTQVVKPGQTLRCKSWLASCGCCSHAGFHTLTMCEQECAQQLTPADVALARRRAEFIR